MKLKWIEADVPQNLEVHQVYAVVFNNEGKILLKGEYKKDGKIRYSLAGGTPESFDKDRIATLRREYIEEVNTTLKDPIYYIGYQYVDEENGTSPYAQVRMTAMIDKIGKPQKDPDNGELYDRKLVYPNEAIKLLNWGEIGEKIVNKAVEVAERHFNLEFKSNQLK